MTAIERAEDLMNVPTRALPARARHYGHWLCAKYGMSRQTFLTAYTTYAAVAEGLPCDDPLPCPDGPARRDWEEHAEVWEALPRFQWYDPHDGFSGCPSPLPLAARAVGTSLDGTTTTAEEAIARYHAALTAWDNARDIVLTYEKSDKHPMLILTQPTGAGENGWRLLRGRPT